MKINAPVVALPRLKRMREALPRGGGLPLEEWQRRHAGIMLVLWANVAAVPVCMLAGGHFSLVHSVTPGIGVGVLACFGAAPRMPRAYRMAAATLGLMSAAALFVHAFGGLIEMHFYFFVLIIVLTLYEDWMPFLLSIVFVLIHHGVIGQLEPRAVFNRPEEWEHPWTWAAIHAAYVAAAGAAAIAAWRLNEDVRGRMREAHRLLEQASTTDSLTGLANRRALMADLSAVVERGEPATLVIFDLDGFKAYNDTFGHPAGDALLARLGGRLRVAIEGQGVAYRLGGDEFCTIWNVGAEQRARAEARSAAALREQGEGFTITAAHGGVTIPEEAATAEVALHTADLRMYSHKQGSRASSGTQSRDVLLQALAELRPQLGQHVDAVTALAEDVAQRLGLPPHVVAQVGHAAQLHDIGKLAIPDAILEKPGSLDEREREFIRTHTVIGERIVSAAPALAEVAVLVRASHERVDGSGYPDRLAGEEIPIGARIIAVCDAFDAMTSNRSYSAAMSPGDALAELRRCAGTQFDPKVVDAFAATLERPGGVDEAPAEVTENGAAPRENGAAPRENGVTGRQSRL